MRSGPSRSTSDSPVPRRGQASGAGHGTPFDAMYEAWRATAVAAALAILESRAEAEDAAERVFLRLWRNGGWWRVEDPEPFFREAGRNEALNGLRRRRKTVPLSADLMETLPAHTRNPAQETARVETWSLVERAIAALPARCRMVCRLVFLDGLTHREVGERLGVTAKAVEKQVARGRRRMKASGVLDGLSSFLDGGG